MLSQKEIEYLRSPENFDVKYRKAVRHRIRNKVHSLREEIKILEQAGFRVMENCNPVTEFSNPEISSNQTAFDKRKWTGGDLNPRPLECKSSVHTS